MDKIYSIRIKIAHIKKTFSAIDLDFLIEFSNSFLPILETYGEVLSEALACIKVNPEKIVIKIPDDFFITKDFSIVQHFTNIPMSDYEPDGGFIGRKNDLKKITELITGNIHKVVTIAGAGGVGKTALAHYVCQNLLKQNEIPYDAIVWVSAKEEKLTVTGIEPIEPTLQNYEGFLNSILETYGWIDEISLPLNEKEENVELILSEGDKGILIVVDNLETIKDERIIEYIKDFPPPNKILITSRFGLGEVERRYTLKEMTEDDAITLLRTIAREKNVESLLKKSHSTLLKFVNKMSRYPLSIKWVIGQIALGEDINKALDDLTSSTGNVVKFCFDYIFDSYLTENAKLVLYTLAANEKPLKRGMLAHISELSPDDLDKAIKDLSISSLVIPEQIKIDDDSLETKYILLPLTRNYIQSKLQSNLKIRDLLYNKTKLVNELVEEADRAGKQYRYSLRDMGAETEEEKVAATLAFTAYQKYQSGNYEEALEDFKRAKEIAPKFPAIYRNWAIMESDAGFYNKVDELMKKATYLDKRDSRLWFVWGNIEKKRNRYDKAYEYYKKALELSPNEAPILGATGEIEKRRGNFQSAEYFLTKSLNSSYSISHNRHEVICFTSLADNLRRWAQKLINDKTFNLAEKKLIDAYTFASKAYGQAKNNQRAHNSILEVSHDLAMLLLNQGDFDRAFNYFLKSITFKPRRAKEMKANGYSCYYLSRELFKRKRDEEGKKFYNLGKRNLFSDSKLVKKYKDLYDEYLREKYIGKVIFISKDKNYGFIELKDLRGVRVFLHKSEIPSDYHEKFENLEGKSLSFSIEKSEKGKNAKNVSIID